MAIAVQKKSSTQVIVSKLEVSRLETKDMYFLCRRKQMIIIFIWSAEWAIEETEVMRYKNSYLCCQWTLLATTWTHETIWSILGLLQTVLAKSVKTWENFWTSECFMTKSTFDGAGSCGRGKAIKFRLVIMNSTTEAITETIGIGTTAERIGDAQVREHDGTTSAGTWAGPVTSILHV